LIGGGTQAEEAESFRREVEQAAPKNVQITGILDDEEFHAVFIAADLVVLPYRKVTQSGIFNLCVAYEVPTLASDKPYFARLETEWNCIELFDPENPTESAALVRSVLNDESLREELLVGMRDYKKTSSMDAVVEKHTNIYNTLVA
jgi:glycosyltransferase involved in cell wall biosynthesis